jgi:hypothetical protein
VHDEVSSILLVVGMGVRLVVVTWIVATDHPGNDPILSLKGHYTTNLPSPVGSFPERSYAYCSIRVQRSSNADIESFVGVVSCH